MGSTTSAEMDLGPTAHRAKVEEIQRPQRAIRALVFGKQIDTPVF